VLHVECVHPVAGLGPGVGVRAPAAVLEARLHEHGLVVEDVAVVLTALGEELGLLVAVGELGKARDGVVVVPVYNILYYYQLTVHERKKVRKKERRKSKKNAK
jgi:hypothetical protein